MAIKLSTTSREGKSHGIKALVYGLAGVGKTTLCKTVPSPIIISNEAGLMSLRDEEIPVIKVATFEDLYDAFNFVTQSDDAKDFKTICLDSISEIAEVILAHEKAQVKDPRAAYGELQVKTLQLCRAFRDIEGRNVYFTAKQARIQNDQKVFVNTPSLPGTKLPQELPYLFDLVMCLRAEEDEEGVEQRRLQTQPTFNYIAKDRSGVLEAYELPDLGTIFSKITDTEGTS